MHYVDVTENSDGTFSVYCYCGYSALDLTSREAADADAESHQNAPEDDDDSELIIGQIVY